MKILKPSPSHVITEGTTLANPHWQYSRDKIACEQLLMKAWREEEFPVTRLLIQAKLRRKWE
jgi:nucleoside-diphosphate-sugar epimerase